MTALAIMYILFAVAIIIGMLSSLCVILNDLDVVNQVNKHRMGILNNLLAATIVSALIIIILEWVLK